MKNKLLTLTILFITVTATLLLSSCSKIFKLDHTTPNESNISTRPPLSIPPNFNLPSPQRNKNSTKAKKTASNSNISKQKLKKPPFANGNQTSSKQLNNSQTKNNNSTSSKVKNNRKQDSIDNLKSNSKIHK
ncbi:MAG: DUF3035 domain-containing protein [Rickettsiales bacterium]|nr:DUF3035 domain-containing protein [Rickettsiales bacterium]